MNKSKEYRNITNRFEYWIYDYIYIYMYVCIWIRYIFGRNYDFLYMIMNNLTMNWFWYPANGVIHWYSETQTNGGYSLVFWYSNQRGLFIGTLISKPMGVIHWYSDPQSRGYSVTIVIRLLRIWITLEHLNYFESLKLHMWFWKCLSIWTILSHQNCLCIFKTYCKL